jgi:hypothetical protein
LAEHKAIEIAAHWVHLMSACNRSALKSPQSVNKSMSGGREGFSFGFGAVNTRLSSLLVWKCANKWTNGRGLQFDYRK